ncbi:MAG: ABC transporter substrate-binding protein [Lysobacterales bacterium]
MHATSRYNGFLIQNIFETLYRYQYLARPYQLKPELALGMPRFSADGLTATITIAPGHYYSDHPSFTNGKGREVTAADVAFSLRRHFDQALRSEGRWLWRDGLQEFDPDNECAPICAQGDEVVFSFRRPFHNLAATLATPFSAIVPQEVVIAEGMNFSRAPVGSGPYTLERLDEFSAVLSANPNYHRPSFDLAGEGYSPKQHPEDIKQLSGRALPLMQRVEVAFIADDAARMIAFDGAGMLDLIRLGAGQVGGVVESVVQPQGPPVHRLKTPLKDRYRMTVAPELGFLRMDLSMSDPSIGHSDDPKTSLRNRRLRCAILSTDSWQRRSAQLYAGMGQAFSGIIPPAAGGSNSYTQPVNQSFDGYFPMLRYGAAAGLRGQQEYDYFKTQLVQAGYPASQIEFLNFAKLGDLISAIGDGKVNVFVFGWAMDFPDPMNNFQLFYGPNRLPGANFSGFDDSTFNQLFAQAEHTSDKTKKEELMAGMSERLLQECVTLSGMSRQSIFLTQKNVVGVPDNGPVNGVVVRFMEKGKSEN